MKVTIRRAQAGRRELIEKEMLRPRAKLENESGPARECLFDQLLLVPSFGPAAFPVRKRSLRRFNPVT